VVEGVEIRQSAAIDQLADVAEGAFVTIEGDADSGEAQEDVDQQDR
jgi:hypothetical protein